MTHELPILKLENLSIGYKHKSNPQVILEQINLTATKGKLISLLGANGVGKSTLLRTIAGMQTSLKGSIFINNTNINLINRELLSRELSIVLTEKPAMMGMKARELVAMGRYPYTNWHHRLSSADQKAVDSAMDQTHTAYLKDYFLYQLSDGQMQKILIARSIAQNTPLILLDEPTAHLDVSNAWDILLLLRKLVDETSKTIIISTHAVESALEVADELWLAECGAPLQSGLTEDIILSNQLNTIYHHPKISFDMHSGRYQIQKERLSYDIQGDENIAKWTEYAFFKNKIEFKGSIKIAEIDSKIEWRVDSNVFFSIEALLTYLKYKKNPTD